MAATDSASNPRLRAVRGSRRASAAAAAARIADELAGGTAEEVSRRLRVLGHPTRVALVVELAAGARSVGELAVATGLDPAAASKHLCELQRASVVVRRQEGTHAIYALANATALRVLLLVAGAVNAEAARTAALLAARS